MKLYPRLAWDGISKNKRLYLPYLLTCVGMVMMFYIIKYLSTSPMLDSMRGGSTMRAILGLGIGVMGVFSVIFLFYTQSFLIRRRNAEFGLYNILGMNKRNISLILCWETLFTAAIAIVGGIALGVLFSKLAELVLIRIMGEAAGFSLRVSLAGVAETASCFAAIFLLILLVSLGRVRLSKPLDLLHSVSVGEKPPKSNWVLAIAGAVLLAAAYYLAVSIKEPIVAVFLFFVAVLMVIVATYLLFITGSVTLCRLLQKKKGYYYRADHFVSVSSMAYRMKRNGAGLASICILSTMVLVMLTSTGCMYFGGTDSLERQYPRDLMLSLHYDTVESANEDNAKLLRNCIMASSHSKAEDLLEYRIAGISALWTEVGKLETDVTPGRDNIGSYGNIRQVYFLPLEDYVRLGGKECQLMPGQVLIYSTDRAYPCDQLILDGGEPLQVVDTLTDFPVSTEMSNIVTCYYVVVSNWDSYVSTLADHYNKTGDHVVQIAQYCGFNYSGDAFALEKDILHNFDSSALTDPNDFFGFGLNLLADAKDDFLALNGSLFFLGIILSIVFIAAAVLIIYYKQISEGYEDQSRFAIMQKVGMTDADIRRSINSQVRTVFAAPLLLAGVHLAFAFPLIWRVLQLLGVNNLVLLLLINVICYLAFAVCYAVIYRLTAKSYYSIVIGAKD